MIVLPGSFGQVFQATDGPMRREPVALKIIAKANAKDALNELTMLTKLQKQTKHNILHGYGLVDVTVDTHVVLKTEYFQHQPFSVRSYGCVLLAG